MIPGIPYPYKVLYVLMKITDKSLSYYYCNNIPQDHINFLII